MSDSQGFDETGLQILKEPGRQAKNKSFFWGFRGGGSEKPTIFFSYNSSRAGKVPKSFLSGYRGYIQTDGYNGYKFIDNEACQIRVGCLAHARRKFIDSIKVAGKNAEPGVAHQAVQIIKQLYSIEKEARESNLGYDEIKQLRQNKAKPILEGFKEKLPFLKNEEDFEQYIPQNIDKTAIQTLKEKYILGAV